MPGQGAFDIGTPACVTDAEQVSWEQVCGCSEPEEGIAAASLAPSQATSIQLLPAHQDLHRSFWCAQRQVVTWNLLFHRPRSATRTGAVHRYIPPQIPHWRRPNTRTSHVIWSLLVRCMMSGGVHKTVGGKVNTVLTALWRSFLCAVAEMA